MLIKNSVSLSLLISTNNKVGANTIQVCTRSTVELFDTRQIYAQMYVHRREKFFIGPSCMYSSATQPIVVLLRHSKKYISVNVYLSTLKPFVIFLQLTIPMNVF